MHEIIAKHKVAQSFSLAATTYDSVAELQRQVGHHLLSHLAQQNLLANPERILDLGSGTGYFSQELSDLYPNSNLMAVDIAEGMLNFAREHRFANNMTWLCADAEQLPLATASVDLVFSSLAIQWCQSPAVLFAEISRVLSPGGLACIATLGPNTLYELRDAWAEVDRFQHVNQFVPLSDLLVALPEGVQSIAIEEQTKELEYLELNTLMKELKRLGAHNMSSQQSGGLTGVGRLKEMRQAYEEFRNDQGQLPASYEVYYLILRREL